VVEEDAAARVEPVRLAVVLDQPVGGQLGHAVRRPGVKRGGLRLRDFLDFAEHLGRRGLVEPRLVDEPELPDGLQQVERADVVRLGRRARARERNPHVALGGQVVHLVPVDRVGVREHRREAGRVQEVRREKVDGRVPD